MKTIEKIEQGEDPQAGWLFLYTPISWISTPYSVITPYYESNSSTTSNPYYKSEIYTSFHQEAGGKEFQLVAKAKSRYVLLFSDYSWMGRSKDFLVIPHFSLNGKIQRQGIIARDSRFIHTYYLPAQAQDDLKYTVEEGYFDFRYAQMINKSAINPTAVGRLSEQTMDSVRKAYLTYILPTGDDA